MFSVPQMWAKLWCRGAKHRACFWSRWSVVWFCHQRPKGVATENRYRRMCLSGTFFWAMSQKETKQTPPIWSEDTSSSLIAVANAPPFAGLVSKRVALEAWPVSMFQLATCWYGPNHTPPSNFNFGGRLKPISTVSGRSCNLSQREPQGDCWAKGNQETRGEPLAQTFEAGQVPAGRQANCFPGGRGGCIVGVCFVFCVTSLVYGGTK